MHADFQGATHVFAALADAGEDDFVRLAAGGQYAFQLATGHDVKTSAKTRQDIEYTQVGVGLDCVAHQVRHAVEGVGERAVLGFDMRTRVHIGRGAEALGNRGQGHAFREQLAVPVVKSVHKFPLV